MGVLRGGCQLKTTRAPRRSWTSHPLFPRAWSDRIGEFFAAAELAWLDGAGHFSPLEAPGEFAAAILAAVRTSPD